MPRPSYEEHRARKRRDSFESETDAGSLASFSTHQSSSSVQPYAYASSSTRLTLPKQRTLSSTSTHSVSSSPSSLLQATLSPRPRYPSRLSASTVSGTSPSTEEATAKRREARRKRREEREKSSTLRAEKYDSLLRKVVRFISRREWKTRSTIIALLAWTALRADMELGRLRVDFPLNRYAFEGFVRRIPHLGPKLIALSDRNQLYLLAFISVTLEAVVWWMSVGRWTTKQAEAGARSWRSQVIATISIMLAPAFALLSTSSLVSATIPLGLVIWGVTLLTLDLDQGATACLLLATIEESKWGLMLPILVAFVAGRIASQGLWKGLVHFHTIFEIVFILSIQKALIGGGFEGYFSSLRESYSIRWISDASIESNGVCGPYTPNFWCTTNFFIRWTNWLSVPTLNILAMTIAAFLVAPIAAIVFYSAFTTRPTPAGSSSQNASLLLIALFTSTLGLALFLPHPAPEAFIIPLVPLTMMSSMRGGKDDMSDGVDWEWTVILHNTITFYLTCTGGTRVKALGLSALQVWNFLLGNNKSNPESSLRELNEYVYMIGMALSAGSIFFAPPPLWDEMLCLSTFVVFLAAWVWGLSRLYLVVWGSVSLGRKNV